MTTLKELFLFLFILLVSIFVTDKISRSKPQIIREEKIIKKNIISNYMESSPFIWNNKIYSLISERDDLNKTFYLAIYDLKANKRVSSKFGKDLSLASIIVEKNNMYIFGTKHWTKYGESEIFLIKSNNMVDFSEPKSIYKAYEKQRIFNTSVTKNSKTGEYLMAIETDEDQLTPFSIRFLKSDNLTYWIMTDHVFGKDTYVACPTIKYVNGYYYLLFGLEYFYDPNCLECKKYITKLSRSKDLITWETSVIPFLLPQYDGKEGLSTADADLVEFNKKTYIHYSISDQSTWGTLRQAEFNGTVEQLFKTFF